MSSRFLCAKTLCLCFAALASQDHVWVSLIDALCLLVLSRKSKMYRETIFRKNVLCFTCLFRSTFKAGQHSYALTKRLLCPEGGAFDPSIIMVTKTDFGLALFAADKSLALTRACRCFDILCPSLFEALVTAVSQRWRIL